MRSVLTLPKVKMQIHVIPKNGGTTIAAWAYFLKHNREVSGNIYLKDYPAMTAPIDRKYLQIIVIRDPVDRFVSGFKDCRRRRGLLADLDKVLSDFSGVILSNKDWAHHMRPQSSHVDHPPTWFDKVINFPDLNKIKSMIEAASNVQLPDYHIHRFNDAPLHPSPEQTERIKTLMHVDYELGFTLPR